MTKSLEVGDVVQLDPACDPIFGGAFMTVTELRSWGAQGFVHHLVEGGARAHSRAKAEHMHYIGRAKWIAADEIAGD